MNTYTFISKSDKILINSRSGGIFTHLSDLILERNGVIYGAVLDEDFNVIHKRATTKTERDAMRGSKYVQSDLNNLFPSILTDLRDNRHVMFTGTACQVGGLLSYCKKNKANLDKLITLDILCHGVPSAKVFKEYLNWNEKKYNDKIIKFDFRNKKKFGWNDHKETLYMKNSVIDSNKFASLFYSLDITRPSCYYCKYKTLNRCSDLTIGDAWGEKDDLNKYGKSLILANTTKGEILFNEAKSQGYCRAVDIANYMQEPLVKSYDPPLTRDRFWYNYKTRGINFYLNDGVLYKIKRLINRKFTSFNKIKESKSKINNVPVLFLEDSNCCGCTACKFICPTHAIEMEENEEGFLYPVINKELCINCGQCLDICDFK